MTIDEIVETALDLVQTRGYNAFSYRDLSELVGIKTASIHYYFPTKADLGVAMMRRYREGFSRSLREIDETTSDPEESIDLYAALFEKTIKTSEKVCLGGMLASEFLSLPEKVRVEVKGFFVDNETWLTRVLRAGKKSGKFRVKMTPESLANTIVSALEGGMLAARTFRDPGRLSSVSGSVRLLLKGTT